METARTSTARSEMPFSSSSGIVAASAATTPDAGVNRGSHNLQSKRDEISEEADNTARSEPKRERGHCLGER